MDSIAKKLGISKSAVSLALAGKYGVSEETRGKVLLEAISMGYELNRSPAGSKQKRVLILISHHETVPESFFSEILLSIERELNKSHIAMELRFLNGDTDANDFLIQIAEDKVGGVIAFSDVDIELLERLRSFRIAVVLIDNRRYHGADFDQVGANNFMGGYNGASWLAELGHRRIAFVGDIRYAISFMERYYGCRACLEERGIEGIYLVEEADADYPPIYNRGSVTKLLASGKNLPSAVFCANDLIAVEIYRLCAIRNLRVPEDISILSFDNTKICERLKPQLTSVNIPREFLGIKAVQLLLSRMAQPDGVSSTLQINCDIARRESVCDKEKRSGIL